MSEYPGLHSGQFCARSCSHLHRLRPSCLLLSLLILIALPTPTHAVTPEYLKATQPIPESLADVPSATDNVGVVPEVRTYDQMLRPSMMLPRLRERIPKTGLPLIDDSLYSVRPRAYYRLRDNGDGTKSEAMAIGGAVSMESGWLNDFLRFGFAGYTSQKIYGPADRDGTGLLREGQRSYTVLGQSFVELKAERTFATIGRTRIDIPYLNANDSRMTPSTFEGITVRSTDLPIGSLDLEKLRIGLGHIRKIRFRDDSNFEYMSVRAGAPDAQKGVTGAGLRYDFSDKFHAGMNNLYGWDTFNTFYAETERYIPLTDDLSLKLGTQFTDQRSVGDELIGDLNAQHLGVKASLGYGSLIASTSFTWTAKGDKIFNPWGGSPSYHSMMLSNFDRSSEKSVRAGLSYDFTPVGLKGVGASASWLYGNTPDSGPDASPDQQEFDVNVDYRPLVKGLENVWLRVRYAVNNRDAALGGLDREDLRIILNYSFTF